MMQNFGGWQILMVVVYLVFVAVVAILLYTVIRLAVRKAMRQHQEWLDGRGN